MIHWLLQASQGRDHPGKCLDYLAEFVGRRQGSYFRFIRGGHLISFGKKMEGAGGQTVQYRPSRPPSCPSQAGRGLHAGSPVASGSCKGNFANNAEKLIVAINYHAKRNYFYHGVLGP